MEGISRMKGGYCIFCCSELAMLASQLIALQNPNPPKKLHKFYGIAIIILLPCQEPNTGNDLPPSLGDSQMEI
jgi:hypothetical protein